MAKLIATVLHADGETGTERLTATMIRHDRVALRKSESRRPSREFRSPADVCAPLLVFFVDNAGCQIGVNRHLLARHRVERKARRNFRRERTAPWITTRNRITSRIQKKSPRRPRNCRRDNKFAEGFNRTGGGFPVISGG